MVAPRPTLSYRNRHLLRSEMDPSCHLIQTVPAHLVPPRQIRFGQIEKTPDGLHPAELHMGSGLPIRELFRQFPDDRRRRKEQCYPAS